MFCKYCGKNIPDDSDFCPSCGQMVALSSDSASPALELSGQAAPGAGTPAASTAVPTPMRRRRPVVIAAAVAAVVAIVALVVAGTFAFLQDGGLDEAHRTSLVTLRFSLPDYGDGEGSGVPVVITGVDLDGADVSERFLAQPTGAEVELSRGAYTVTVAGPPINDAGVLYQPAAAPVQLVIDESGPTSAPEVNFTPVPAGEVTDEQIEQAREWMADFGVEQDVSERVVSLVQDRRQQELDRIAEEQRQAEEAARAQAEEEARQAAEAERQQALASNPSTIRTGIKASDAPRVAVTGVVRTGVSQYSGISPDDPMLGDKYGKDFTTVYLELPATIMFDWNGTGTLDPGNNVILPDEFATHEGQTVTISSWYQRIDHGYLPAAKYSMFYASDVQIIRTF